MGQGRTRQLSINPGLDQNMVRLISEQRNINKDFDRRKIAIFANNAARPPARDNLRRIIFVRQADQKLQLQISDGLDWQTFVLSSGNPTLAASTYTPTLTSVANVTASTAYACQYMRVGNTVTVGGKFDIDPTAAANTQLGISLPVASNIGAAEQCGGTAASASGTNMQAAAIRGDAANDRAEMVAAWNAGDLANQSMYFTFTYTVI